MKPYRKFFSELIGFSRRERRGTYLLSMMILALIIIRAVAYRTGGDPPSEQWISSTFSNPSVPKEPYHSGRTLFMFDPNRASEGELIALGFTSRQAKTLINYRNSGAVFHDPDDLLKVYGVDSLFVSEIEKWIIIPQVARSGIKEKSDWHEKKTDISEFQIPEVSHDLIDLNHCSAADLEALPGIGQVLSERIIKYRNLLGGYADKSQLMEVYGLDSAVVVSISSMLKVSASDVVIIMVDTCGFVQMAKHPYIGAETARAIIRYRHLMGSDFTIDDLVKQRVLTADKAALMVPYVSTSGSGLSGQK